MVLDDLKISYHTFRVLLANNERSLDQLRNLERLLAAPGASWSELSDEIEELLNVTYELVDGLSRLTGGAHAGLYQRHRALSLAIRQSLGTVVSAPPDAPRCIPLENLTPDQKSIVGGKAASLGLLKQSGLPVPDGFAITSTACGEILSTNDLDSFIGQVMHRFETEGARAVVSESDLEEIRERIMEASLPRSLKEEIRRAYESLTSGDATSVSVRSSALVEDRPEHTFAGQFKSVLNVTSFESLEAAVKEVLASNFNARSTSYRLHAGLPLAEHDMAVLCQCMAPARAAGVLFTVDPAFPENERMLISAVPGLGTLAVGGEAPADIYRPLRDEPDREKMEAWAEVAVKTRRAVSLPQGGIREEDVPEDEREISLLSESEALSLARYGRAIESLVGTPQDIEWAVTATSEIAILQARDIRLAQRDRRSANLARGQVLLDAGVCASPGRRLGRAKLVHSLQDLEEWRKDPCVPSIMILRRSIVDASRWLPEFEGVVVDLGNPADHLSCVAREYSRPMLTGTGKATEVLQDGQWIVLDADRTQVLQAPEDVLTCLETIQPPRHRREVTRPDRKSPVELRVAHLRDLIEPLNLTDAYGPTFSIQECKSVHDVIRYTHEMAVLAMFSVGDEALEGASRIVRRLDEGIPFYFMIIDLSGGIAPGRNSFRIRPDDILSVPLRALWDGVATPGLRWNKPPPGGAVSGLLTRAMLDGRGARPVGNQNYALITRDYLNLNARVDYHFAMIDTVCGSNPRGNYIRFRFKGGGTSAVQRERRARFIAEVLQSLDFFTDQRDDLVTASLTEMRQEVIQERLTMMGRLLGFSRLLDATMSDDTVPHQVAQAFLAGDYDLKSLEVATEPDIDTHCRG
jgi:pyruvate, water dikinase